jgi:glycosyltransferase involved in cell wall biosynthesis
MKVLVVAPHPWYQERGTPIAVDLLVRALSEQGHEVDLLTFNEGEDRNYPGLRIIRVNPSYDISGVAPGFSRKKLILDVYLFFKMIGLVLRNRYDVIHAVEESAFFAMILAKFKGSSFIYDMDSSMSTQLVDRFPPLKKIEGGLRFMESLPIRSANAVAAVCQSLADEANLYRDNGVFIIKDVTLVDENADQSTDIDVRERCGISGPVFIYIGNLESYQGIDLMLESFAKASTRCPDAGLAVIGGSAEKIEHYQQMVNTLGVADKIHFLGQQPVAQIQAFMSQADVMLSPRTQGNNTPMKIYSYLDSGRAVLATDLPTHTQAVDTSISALAAPETDAFADAIVTLANDPDYREDLAIKAKEFVKQNHSYPVFFDGVESLYDYISKQR